MSEERKCLRCGSANLTPGSIQSTGKVGFRAKNAKFLTTKTADIPVNGNICVDCGYIELIGSADKAKSLVGTS